MKNISQSCSIKARIGWQGLTKAEYQKAGEYLLITGTDFDNGTICWNTCSFVSKERFAQDKNIQIKDGDVLITKDGTIGKVAFLEKIPQSGTLNSGVFVIRPLKSDINQTFLSYIFKSKYFDEFLNELIAGSTINHFYQKDFIFFDFPLPNKQEQIDIATALSDIDSLIEAFNKKIAKKRAIKEGVMQQLLTGKKRLSGFSEPWEEKKLGEIGKITRGASPRPIDSPIWFDESSKIGWVRISDVSNSNKFLEKTEQKLSELGIKYSRYIPENSLIMSICATIGKPIITKINACIHDGFVFFSNLLIDADFLYYYLTSIEKDWSKNGQTGSQMNLNTTLINSTEIYFPKIIEEQQAIAQILTNMDNEIEQLEKERQKYTALKQGAMQKLLTGQIRLVSTAIQPQKTAEIRTISTDAHVIGGHIVNELYRSKGWGRTKLQKSIHLIDYYCQLDFGGEYIRNVAGPDDQSLMKHIDYKFRQYGHVRIETKNEKGSKHYNYIPTPKIAEVEQAFEHYPVETRKTINDLLNKIKKMDLARAEIVSTLYAVWNNRIIKEQPVNDDLLLEDFYDWSEHKSDFSRDLVLRGLNYMRQENIIPVGWGKYIDKK